jgi:hypothetical protein
MDLYVKNPMTGRNIKVGGPTYKRLHLQKMSAQIGDQPHKKLNGGGSATRGWAQDAPRKGNERHRLKKECFLLPDTEGFPICPKCGDVCNCQLDCRGLTAAKVRAHQYKHTELYERIDQLLETKCRH